MGAVSRLIAGDRRARWLRPGVAPGRGAYLRFVGRWLVLGRGTEKRATTKRPTKLFIGIYRSEGATDLVERILRFYQIVYMPPSQRPRRFNNQRFLLTYSHIEPTIPDVHEGNVRGSLVDFCDDVRLHLLSIASFHWAEAVTELHDDGTPHVHVVLVLRQR